MRTVLQPVMGVVRAPSSCRCESSQTRSLAAWCPRKACVRGADCTVSSADSSLIVTWAIAIARVLPHATCICLCKRCSPDPTPRVQRLWAGAHRWRDTVEVERVAACPKRVTLGLTHREILLVRGQVPPLESRDVAIRATLRHKPWRGYRRWRWRWRRRRRRSRERPVLLLVESKRKRIPK